MSVIQLKGWKEDWFLVYLSTYIRKIFYNNNVFEEALFSVDANTWTSIKLGTETHTQQYFQSRKQLYNPKCPFVRLFVRLSVWNQNPQTA